MLELEVWMLFKWDLIWVCSELVWVFFFVINVWRNKDKGFDFVMGEFFFMLKLDWELGDIGWGFIVERVVDICEGGEMRIGFLNCVIG